MTEFPSADDIAIAIIAACRQTGENPEDVALGSVAQRARRYAYKVLTTQFPLARKIGLAKAVGASAFEAYPYAKPESWFKIAVENATRRLYMEMGGSIRGLR